MASKENIRDRVRKINPQALIIFDEFDRRAKETGYEGVSVITTEDMTPGEEEMALFEGFLKEGYPPDQAEKKAREWLSLLDRLKR